MRSDVMKGMAEMQKRLKSLDFIAVPTGPFLRDWRQDLKNEAIKRAPEWKGDIIRSLQDNQDTAKFPLWARVFSDAPQARWTNYGTGILSEDPESPRQRYFPSVEGVSEWAQDHGWEPGALAHFIYMRGGTPPTHWFSLAAAAADATMNERMARFSHGIERQASAG